MAFIILDSIEQFNALNAMGNALYGYGPGNGTENYAAPIMLTDGRVAMAILPETWTRYHTIEQVKTNIDAIAGEDCVDNTVETIPEEWLLTPESPLP